MNSILENLNKAVVLAMEALMMESKQNISLEIKLLQKVNLMNLLVWFQAMINMKIGQTNLMTWKHSIINSKINHYGNRIWFINLNKTAMLLLMQPKVIICRRIVMNKIKTFNLNQIKCFTHLANTNQKIFQFYLCQKI